MTAAERLWIKGLVIVVLVLGQGSRPSDARFSKRAAANAHLAQLVEANVIATHAFQVLLAKRSGKGEAGCYQPGRLSDHELESLVEHQGRLLKSDLNEIKVWVNGVGQSKFDVTSDLNPILNSGLSVPANAPINVFTEYLRRHTNAEEVGLRSIASLYQTVLEVERDGDLLQDQYAFYIGLGLPVYLGQLSLPGSDQAMLAIGRELAPKTCVSPFATDAPAWQIAGRKIWNWGEKNLHIRDEKTLASELLHESDVKALVPQLRNLSSQRIAVIGHSFTMGLHWSSPSSFVPIVIEIFQRVNPKIEFKQFAAGGLTASRAQQRFYRSVLEWKPDAVLFVVMTRTNQDYDALGQMGKEMKAAGIRSSMFDDVHDPASVDSGTVKRAVEVARTAGIDVIEVGKALSSAPDRSTFVCLDGIHMTEPYHRLMAKEWLKFLASWGRTNPNT